jgi:peptidoglycan/LPS O-acetylase OafA/YrhL
MVWLGSAARIPERLKPACAWLGNWSYPLYVLHVPVIGLVSLLALHTHLGARSQGFLAVTAAVLVAAAFVPLELMVRKALERRLTAPRRPPVLVGPVVPQRFA